MCAPGTVYPRSFVRRELAANDKQYKDALRGLGKLDKEAVELRKEYIRLENTLFDKAKRLLTSKETSEAEVQELLESEEFKALEAKRQEVHEKRAATLRITAEAYDSLDATIQKLDSEMAQLEPQVAATHAFMPPPPNNRKRSKKEQQRAEMVQALTLAPAKRPELEAPDPNEPVYCTCRRVSFGQMVACENEECQYEWFHYACVGLTQEPTGAWYCPHCRQGREEASEKKEAQGSQALPTGACA